MIWSVVAIDPHGFLDVKTNDPHKLYTNQSITNTYKERAHAYGVTHTSFIFLSPSYVWRI